MRVRAYKGRPSDRLEPYAAWAVADPRTPCGIGRWSHTSIRVPRIRFPLKHTPTPYFYVIYSFCSYYVRNDV